MGSKNGKHRGEKWSRMPRIGEDGSHRPGTLRLDERPEGRFGRNAVLRWYDFVRKAERMGVLPVDVMIDNIAFEHKQITLVTADINRMCADLQDDDSLTPDARAHMVAEVASMLAAVKGARARAQQYACDLAPYLHPRLANITVTDGRELPSDIPQPSSIAQVVALSPDDAAQTYLRLVKGDAPEQEVIPPGVGTPVDDPDVAGD